MRLFDRALRAIGLQRRPKPRAAIWTGAREDRLMADWVYDYLSADQTIRGDLRTLRARARELVRNDPWARRYVTLMVKNVIGPRGIQLQARLVRPSELPNDEANDKIESAWARWGRRGMAGADSKLSWLGIQRLAVKNLAADGEVLIRILRGFDNAFGFALEFLDPDQLDETLNRNAGPGQNAIRMGVEVDGWRRPVLYHLWRNHPSEVGGRQAITVPAEDIIHLFDPDRVNQTRGVPRLAPVMLPIHMLGGYYEAELVASREAAAKGGFYTQSGEDGVAIDVKQEDLTEDVEPGKRNILPVGMAFQPWDPQHPTSAFPDFSKAILHQMASGLDVSYASLTNDLADTSYSSSRVGLLDERDGYRDIQGWLIEGLHARVYAAWVPFAVLHGQLDARIRREDYLTVAWVPRGWAWIDPEKDINAAILGIDNGLQSRTRVLAEEGVEFEDVVDDLVKEQALLTEKGLTLGTDATDQARETRTDRQARDLEDATPAGRLLKLGNGR